MDAEYANYYTREVMLILIREFQSPDEEMKKIVLKVNSLLNNFIKILSLKLYAVMLKFQREYIWKMWVYLANCFQSILYVKKNLIT